MVWAKWLLLGSLLLMGLGALVLFEGDRPAEEIDPKYTSDTSQFLTLGNGAKLHFRDEGNPAGPPLVLIHGSNASLHAWEPWVAELGDTWRMVTMDLPGHGLTGSVPDKDYSSAAFVRAVNALVDHLGISQFVLGGNSMGGGVTWRYALAYPDQVAAMVLIDASGPQAWRNEVQTEATNESGQDRPLAFELLGKPWFRALARYLDPLPLVRPGLESAYNNSPVINDTLVARYYDLHMRAGGRQATLDRFAGYAAADGAEPDLSTLQQPTLILWGREDSLIPLSIATRFEEVLPQAKAIVYDNIGHVPMEEIPARSARDLREFLRHLDDKMVSPQVL